MGCNCVKVKDNGGGKAIAYGFRLLQACGKSECNAILIWERDEKSRMKQTQIHELEEILVVRT